MWEVAGKPKQAKITKSQYVSLTESIIAEAGCRSRAGGPRPELCELVPNAILYLERLVSN